jgi:hypothetical protein
MNRDSSGDPKLANRSSKGKIDRPAPAAYLDCAFPNPETTLRILAVLLA